MARFVRVVSCDLDRSTATRLRPLWWILCGHVRERLKQAYNSEGSWEAVGKGKIAVTCSVQSCRSPNTQAKAWTLNTDSDDSLPENFTMYRPKFCAECSAKIIRLRWHFWTSRRFCESCSPRFLREQLKRAAIAGATVFLLGMVVGQAARRTPPPVVIQRTQNPTSTLAAGKANQPAQGEGNSSRVVNTGNTPIVINTAEIYACGARTKKGTPCTRRVHGPVRCWQHLGLPAMQPQEQLRIKAN